jgi:hypothetical protein
MCVSYFIHTSTLFNEQVLIPSEAHQYCGHIARHNANIVDVFTTFGCERDKLISVDNSTSVNIMITGRLQEARRINFTEIVSIN